jgi:A/G-specific adenine glycosylase
MSSTTFKRAVWAHYKRHGRHELPWRKTLDPYKILVSEVMLQQTQVERAVPFYKNFLTRFPTVRALAKAPLAEVLRAWQGLGYNRRAKMLHAAAKVVVAEHKGKFPKTRTELEQLPGIGPYTAGAVAAFAYNHDVIFIETNIRTAVTHHFVAQDVQHQVLNKRVADAEVLEVLKKLLPKGRSREWYSALMDYGAYLKKSGVKLNTRSKHYTKQSKFAGSTREARGAIFRALAAGPASTGKLSNLLGPSRKEQLKSALEALEAEQLLAHHGRVWMLRD